MNKHFLNYYYWCSLPSITVHSELRVKKLCAHIPQILHDSLRNIQNGLSVTYILGAQNKTTNIPSSII